jgi:hypothetical protein
LQWTKNASRGADKDAHSPAFRKGESYESHALQDTGRGLFCIRADASTSSATAANQKQTRGNKAEIVLTRPAQVGNFILPPGHYAFQHVVSAGQNIATFMGPINEESSSLTIMKVNCTNEPLKQKAG